MAALWSWPTRPEEKDDDTEKDRDTRHTDCGAGADVHGHDRLCRSPSRRHGDSRDHHGGDAAIAVGHRASKIIGTPVYNEQGEKVGDIDDLIVTPDRTLSYAIVSVGGFLGLVGRLIAIPVEQIRAERDKLILPRATKEELKKVPEFQYAS